MSNFKKTHYLRNKEDYDRVFKKALKKSTPEFILLYRENTLQMARLGFILSKKNIAKACQRNRIKRLLRESFRQQSLPALDIIFLARHGIARVNNKILRDKVQRLWNSMILK